MIFSCTWRDQAPGCGRYGQTSRLRLMLATAWCVFSSFALAATDRPNLLLITVDDMNADSVGVFGSSVPATTPHIDQLASTGLRFERAHVQVANCTPSRNVMWSGRYPHSNKVEGFYQVREPDYRILPDLLHEAGYFTAIRHKVNSSTPFHPYAWDLVLDTVPTDVQHNKKDAKSYGLSTTLGIKAAKAAGKPFSLIINIADPHVPFYGLDKNYKQVEDILTPSRIYSANEITVPGYLVDDPVIRQELSHYYSSVRRADDAVGYILRALEQSGAANNTLVMFLSDHGMAFPFAKTQLYHHSTWTPLLFRWPGSIKKGAVDARHMVSAIDILPTLLDVAGVPIPQGVEGRSLLPLLMGETQSGRGKIFKEYHENSKGQRAPMRAVQSARFLYIFNPWSNGKRAMASATFHSNSYRRMMELAKNDNQLAQRMNLLRYRTLEEFYDIQDDPNCLVNLIDKPAYKADIEELRTALARNLRETNDGALIALTNRKDSNIVARYVSEQDQASQQRRDWVRVIGKELRKQAERDVSNNAQMDSVK